MFTKKALILEDDRVTCAVLRQVVETMEYEAFEARTGAQASKLLDARAFDLVIVDGLLPDTDGLKWLEKERARLQGPVVFVSSFWKDIRSFKRLTEDLRVDLVAPKPLDPVDLIRRIKRIEPGPLAA